MLAPSALPGATLADVQALLSALLPLSPGAPASASELQARLAQQTHAALLDLASDERPTSYEGLLDVARFCVEEEPAWAEEEQQQLCKACAEDSIDALWDAATARTASVTAAAASGAAPTAAAPQAESSTAASKGSTPLEPADEAFDQPFLALSVFSKLVQASPVLSHFFEQDLSASFQLRAPAPPQESAREALATLAAVAVTGGGGGQSTARRVRGLLGGLLGEVGDRVGKVTGRETRTGPLPSFGQQTPASLAESSTSQAALGAKTAAAASSSLGRSVQDAEEDVRAATARLVEQAASSEGAFVIDEAVGEDDDDDGDDDDEEEAGELSLAALGGGEEEQAGGREQRIAKDLRTAAAAQ